MRGAALAQVQPESSWFFVSFVEFQSVHDKELGAGMAARAVRTAGARTEGGFIVDLAHCSFYEFFQTI